MITDRSAITVKLADVPLAQVSIVVHSDELWEKLDRISNVQMAINLERELERLTFEKDEEWDGHVHNFHVIIGNLAEYDQPVSPFEKVSEMIRKFPQRFAPIEMVNLTDSLYQRL